MTRTTEAVAAAKDSCMTAWLSPRRLLIAAAVFHLVVTMGIYGLGRYAALPGTFDTYGIAVSFAPDGTTFREEAVKLANDVVRGEIREWLIATSPFHVKLYSLCFALLGPWFGSTILSAEPLNVVCYLAILVLVFHLSQATFNRRAGLLAAATVALWPSFVLHTTQLVRDPLFLVGMLAFILVNLHLLSRTLSWPRALVTGAAGGLIAVFVWMARDNLGELLIATVALGALLLIVRQFWKRHFHAANLVGMAMLIVLSVGVTRVIPKFRKSYPHRGAVETTVPASVSPGGGSPGMVEAPLANPLSRIAARVGKLRHRFVVVYPDSSSNIDSNVQLDSTADLIRFLPRAAVIGFFSPFPNMWLATGNHVGSAGRLLSGLETMAMYVVEGLAVVGLWRGSRRRRRLSVWFLWLVAAMGMISLGLVVVNIGALYRMRYLFLILLIILAAEGAAQSIDWCKKKRSPGSWPATKV